LNYWAQYHPVRKRYGLTLNRKSYQLR
jgi:hypothetical protein